MKSVKENKKELFKKVHEEKKLQVAFFLISMFLVLGIYFAITSQMRKSMLTEKIMASAVEEDLNALACIEEVQAKSEMISLSGWALVLNTEIIDAKVVLSSVDEEEIQILETSFSESDVLKRQIEYLELDNSTIGKGFIASVKEEELKQDVCYKVQLHLTITNSDSSDNSKKISLEQYLYNGEIYDYNPEKFIAPVFNDEQMTKVTEEGKLCGYSDENGAWVYRYEYSLYWILDKSVEQNRDESLWMFFHLYPVRTKDLSEERRKYGFDNKDFIFATKEILTKDDSLYRVASVKIDSDYVIKGIKTGHYDSLNKRNVWSLYFKMFAWD